MNTKLEMPSRSPNGNTFLRLAVFAFVLAMVPLSWSEGPVKGFQKMDTEALRVAITFDDGPGSITEPLLDLLRDRNVFANFFVLGEKLKGREEVLKRAIREGHLIGNHSWSHPHCSELTLKEFLENEFDPTRKALKKILGNETAYYRPPFGSYSEEQLNHLRSDGISTVLWSISTHDWDESRNSAEEIVGAVEANLEPGAIVLMHDGEYRPEDEAFLSAVDGIIQSCRNRGYEFVRLDEFPLK